MHNIFKSNRPKHVVTDRPLEQVIVSQPAEQELLRALGLTSLKQLLEFLPMTAAGAVLAVSRNERPLADLNKLVIEQYLNQDLRWAARWPPSALSFVDAKTAAILEQFGIFTLQALANFGPRKRAEAMLDEQTEEIAYQPPLSAPAELMPKMTGAITSLYRYNSFIRDRDLRDLKISLDKDCAPETILTQIFEDARLRCPVLYLGRLAGYSQRWVLQGTYLGEVRHSLALAPGESRNIAIVDWRRAQRTGRDEDTVGEEDLAHFERHNRTLDEAAGGVAKEHQWGSTETAAVTAAGALGAVAAGGVVGGAGGALGGAALGSLAAGVGAVPGALAGAAVGGLAGVASAGLAVAGAGVLGMIRADTNGDRDVEGEAAQDIMMTTRQKSSVERSLRSSVVLEDVQSERDDLQTSTVTNYNHMHALTVQYYEILHRYGVSIELDARDPLLVRPFAAVPFDAKNFVNLWPFIRILFGDAEMVRLIDEKLGYAKMDIEKVEVEVPEEPEEPISPDSLEIRKVKVEVRVSQPLNDVSARLAWMDGTGATRINDLRYLFTERGRRILHFDSQTPEMANAMPLRGTQLVGIEIILSMQFPIQTNVEVTVEATQGSLGAIGEEVASTVLDSQTFYPASVPSDTADTKRFPWNAAWGLSAAYYDYAEAKKLYDAAKEAEAKAEEDYDKAIETREEAQKEAFTKLLLLANGRRFALTREYIQQAEPEVLAVLLDALVISDGDYDLPLHRIAHSVPIAVAGSFLVLRMKRLPDKKLPFSRFPDPLAARTPVRPDLAELVGHPQWVIDRWRRLHERPLSAEIIDLPTSGLFAEAILGRSNAAEKLDLTRQVAWHEMPIPHQPPAIAALTAGSRAQFQDATPSTLPNTINIVNPPSFPEPTGLAEAFATLRTSDLFRDMSKAGELAGIIGNLTQLAGSLGEAATQMTGDAAARALESAGEIGKVAAGLANQAMLEGGRLQAAANKPSQTSLGSRLNALKEQQGLLTDPQMIQAYEDSIHELLKDGGFEFVSAGRDGDRGPNRDGGQASLTGNLIKFALDKASELGAGLRNWRADPEGELSDALQSIMMEIAEKEMLNQGKALVKRIPMGSALLVAVPLAIEFATGAGEQLQKVNRELAKEYAELESKVTFDPDGLSQEEIDALRSLTSYQNTAVQKLPQIMEAGVRRAAAKLVDIGAGAMKKFIGDNATRIARELAKNNELIALISSAVEEGRSKIPSDRKTTEERLVGFMVKAFIKQLPKGDLQKALGDVVKPVRGSQPVVIELIGGLANALVQGALRELGPYEESVKRIILDSAGNTKAEFDAVGTLVPSGSNDVEIEGTVVRAPQSVITAINNAAGTPDETLFEIQSAGDTYRVHRDLVELAIKVRAFELQRQFNSDPTPQNYDDFGDELLCAIANGAREVHNAFSNLQRALRGIFEAAGDTTYSQPDALQTFIKNELYLESQIRVWGLVRSELGLPQVRNTHPHDRGRQYTSYFLDDCKYY